MVEGELRYLEWPRKKWLEDKNPIYPWITILSCYKNGDILPDWTIKYFAECAEKLLTLDSKIGDFGRKLPLILGFDRASGPKHQLKAIARMVEIEKMAMQFAGNILKGREPSQARSDIQIRGWDEPKVRKALKKHFQLKRAPNSNRGWQTVIFNWLFENPSYQERYPHMPRLTDLLWIKAEISRDSRLT